MPGFRIHYDAAGAGSRLAGLLQKFSHPQDGLLLAGRAVANEWKSHLRALNQTHPNKLGGPRTNFWAQLADSIDAPKPLSGSKVEVILTDVRAPSPTQARTISATNAEALTIPINPLAYDRRVSVLARILGVPIFRLPGTSVLGANLQGRGLVALYVLRKEVTIPADPDVLLDEDDAERAAGDALEIYLDSGGR